MMIITKFMPFLLNDEQKRTVSFCQDLNDSLQMDMLLSKAITADKIWFYGTALT